MITSTANPRVKDVLALRRSKERRSSGRFVVEGSREVHRCLAAGVDTEVIYRCVELGGTLDPPDDVEVIDVSPSVFERMSQRQGPDGVLAVARDLQTDLGALRLGENPLVLVAVGIEKPGNLGTMIRSAAAAGADAFIMSSPVCDAVNPNAIRASQGAVFAIPIGVGVDDEVVVDFLAGRRIAIYAADPGAAAPYWTAPFESPTAIVIGAEHHGVPPLWRRSSQLVSIPMGGGGGVDSLNASAAAAVLLFDAARRRAGSLPPTGRIT